MYIIKLIQEHKGCRYGNNRTNFIKYRIRNGCLCSFGLQRYLYEKMNWKKACIIGLYFGGFQAIMPVIGYFFGSSFESIITNIDHWLAFYFIGNNRHKNDTRSISKEEEEYNEDISVKTMIVLSIATSIDALAVGITFAFLKVNLLLAITLIGTITFILSVIGTKIGNRFGDKYKSKAELAGGIILIIIGLKILLEHIGIIS